MRACPTCLTKVKDVQLGLRDFRWAASALPGKVAPSDVDFVLERHGRFLVIEFKPTDGYIGTGQRIMLKALEARGMTVLVVRGDGPSIAVSTLNGDVSPDIGSVDALADFVADWFHQASREEREGSSA